MGHANVGTHQGCHEALFNSRIQWPRNFVVVKLEACDMPSRAYCTAVPVLREKPARIETREAIRSLVVWYNGATDSALSTPLNTSTIAILS